MGRHAGHYRILKPVLIEAEGRSIPLDAGSEIWIPAERVVAVEVLNA